VHCRGQQSVKLFPCYRIVSELSYALPFFNQRIHVCHLLKKYQFTEKKSSFPVRRQCNGDSALTGYFFFALRVYFAINIFYM
jgi:hypothetical protein